MVSGSLFGMKTVYWSLCLCHLFCFWNSAVFILNAHVSHFCSDQKNLDTLQASGQISVYYHKARLLCEVPVNYFKSHFLRNPLSLSWNSAGVSKPNDKPKFCWCSLGKFPFASCPRRFLPRVSIYNKTAALVLAEGFVFAQEFFSCFFNSFEFYTLVPLIWCCIYLLLFLFICCIFIIVYLYFRKHLEIERLQANTQSLKTIKQASVWK